MRLRLILSFVGLLLLPAGASASVSSVLASQTIAGSAIPCTTQSDGVRVCHGNSGGGPGPDLRLKSFDGVPLESYVILPPASASSRDGGYPLIIQSHGYGGQAGGPNDTQFFGPTGDVLARRGYAVLQLTARGFNDSCGSAASRLIAPAACANGYIRLDDNRYEVRDIQYAAGLLVDSGLVDPNRVGATGESYGGGVSLQLASLKDRMMMQDGKLVPWVSRGGTPMHLAAAVPVIPWSDLVYSLLPNGRTLDTQIATSAADRHPIGVEKQSFVAGLFASGAKSGQYSSPGLNPEADLTTWFKTINSGEPYDGNSETESIANTIAHYHSGYPLLEGAYGIPREAPAPLLVANGFTDDLFPVDEAVRYANLDHSLYPSNPISLFGFDAGHMRGQNKKADLALLVSRVQSFLDHYVAGSGPQPFIGATALTQTCPAAAPSGGPYSASSWAALHPGEVTFSASAAQTILSTAGSAAISQAIDPVAGKGACATTPSADQGSGVATYRLPPATAGGYTLLGSPLISANLSATGNFPYVAERLWDVDPASGTQTLVARGVYRLDPAHPNGRQTFQLHPGAWHFSAGHIPKLELLSQDVPYLRAANGSFSVTISGLTLLMPVHEQPGMPGSPPGVKPPVRKPPGVKPPVRKPPGVKPPVAKPPFGCGVAPQISGVFVRYSVSRRRLQIAGRTAEVGCGGSANTTRTQHVTRVLVWMYRIVGPGRCRFVMADGHLSRTRSCNRPIRFLARGTARWSVRIHGRYSIPSARYHLRVEARDNRHRHASTLRVVQIR